MYSHLLFEINENTLKVDPLEAKKIPFFATSLFSPVQMNKFVNACIDSGIGVIKVALLVACSLLVFYYIGRRIRPKDKMIHTVTTYSYPAMTILLNTFYSTSRLLEKIYEFIAKFTNLAKKSVNLWNTLNRVPRGVSLLSTLMGMFFRDYGRFLFCSSMEMG